MPRQVRPPRLWLRPARRNGAGEITHAAAWIILDGGRQFSTGIHAADVAGGQQALADYINKKHTAGITKIPRDIANIPVADVLNLYVTDVVPKHHNPAATLRRITRLAKFFGRKYLSEVNGPLCREYHGTRAAKVSIRKDLEDLRAAINHHHREGLHTAVIKVVLPPKPVPRERWLTRQEAAQLVRHCWRFKDPNNGTHSKRHLARFILVGLYTGSRAGVILNAALQREVGRPYFDLDNGVFYRRPEGARETRKRRPTVRIPSRLLAHLRRWKGLGARFAVEWNGRTVHRIDEPFRHAVAAVGLTPPATPHTLRHTCATWMMQRGADPWNTSGFLGMTLLTLMATYGHHHPDHMGDVHETFGKRTTPMLRQRLA